jgi:hypothetical protein
MSELFYGNREALMNEVSAAAAEELYAGISMWRN